MTTMDELSRLASHYGSDKVVHGFTPVYDRFLAERRSSVRKLLEIGVLGGASLRMWRDYLPAAEIHGVDIAPPPLDDRERIFLHTGDQANRADLAALIEAVGDGVDVLIDDGGHTMEQQQVSLAVLLPVVTPGGLYIVEDLHTSFMDEIGWYVDGVLRESYRTGVGEGVLTTFDFLVSLPEAVPKRSPFMTEAEHAMVRESVAGIELFDRDGDRQHMTAILHKRAAG